ncbi:hypothetical protein OG582_39895 (plasmid) [Streptomyces anulatus]|uniref:hypothetical protein n=1 Tax=Streptomyces anulatus TaxID=1892 RepID=UPI00324AFDFF
MSALEPGDCDRVGPDGVAVDGGGGVDAATMAELAGFPFALPETAGWLSPDQQVRLLAVVGTVTAAVRVLANDPVSVIEHGELSRMCAPPGGSARHRFHRMEGGGHLVRSAGWGVRSIVRNSAHRARAGPHPRATAWAPPASVARGQPHVSVYGPRVGQNPAQKAAQAARGQQPKKPPGKAQREAIKRAQAARKKAGGGKPAVKKPAAKKAVPLPRGSLRAAYGGTCPACFKDYAKGEVITKVTEGWGHPGARPGSCRRPSGSSPGTRPGSRAARRSGARSPRTGGAEPHRPARAPPAECLCLNMGGGRATGQCQSRVVLSGG